MPFWSYYLPSYDYHEGSIKIIWLKVALIVIEGDKSSFLVSSWAIQARGRAGGGVTSGGQLFLMTPETCGLIELGWLHDGSCSKGFFCSKWVLFDGPLTLSGDFEMVRGGEHTLLFPVGCHSMIDPLHYEHSMQWNLKAVNYMRVGANFFFIIFYLPTGPNVALSSLPCSHYVKYRIDFKDSSNKY